MELWIRSQDKLKLVKNPNLCINNEFVDKYVIDGLSNGRYLELATYKTRKRALEILEEIQELLEPKIEYTPIIDEDLKPEYTYKHYRQIGSETSVMELNTYVYQMPEE